MADNVPITAGAGTAIAADDIGGVWFQRVKPAWGPDGSATDASVAAPLPIQNIPVTSGGLSIAHLVAAGSGDATSVKAAAGQLYGVEVFNNAATPRYVKFHDTAGAPTPGASVVLTVGVQAGVGRTVTFPNGVAFGTGIAMTLVTGLADNSNTGVTAADLVVDVLYK